MINVLTHEEAKTKQLIPVNNIFRRDDWKTQTVKVYIFNDSKHQCKTYEDFLNKRNRILEVKVERHTLGDSYYVLEDNEWKYIGCFDCVDRAQVTLYEVEDYITLYVLKEDLDEYIKVKQADLKQELKEREEKVKEYNSVFAWTNNLFDF